MFICPVTLGNMASLFHWGERYGKIASLGDDNECEELVGSSEGRCQKRSSRIGFVPLQNTILVIIIVLLILELLAGFMLWYRFASCTCVVARTSPITEDVKITYQEERFNGSLLKENIYRQAASPEVDAAWEGLGVNCTTAPVYSQECNTDAEHRS